MPRHSSSPAGVMVQAMGGGGGSSAGTSDHTTCSDLPACGFSRVVATASLANTWLASSVARAITAGANQPCKLWLS